MRKVKRIKLSKAFRTKIFERDNYECQKCSKNLIQLEDERVIDHKIPLSKGGGNSISNLWLLCLSCDRAKKDNLEDDLLSEYIKGKLSYLQNKQFRFRGKNARNNNKKDI
jgi:5-methylcytosine-specific restriction endonuclease McrA